MNTTRTLVVLAAGVALAAVVGVAAQARPTSPAGSAAGFLSHVVSLIAANRYADAYPLLNPQQQRLIGKQEYVQCELRSPVPGQLTSLRVLRTAQQLIKVAGGSGRSVPATAVTFELTLTGRLPDESATIDLTAHAVAAGNRWTWILSPRRFRLHRSGNCAGGAAPEYAAAGLEQAAIAGSPPRVTVRPANVPLDGLVSIAVSNVAAGGSCRQRFNRGDGHHLLPKCPRPRDDHHDRCQSRQPARDGTMRR